MLTYATSITLQPPSLLFSKKIVDKSLDINKQASIPINLQKAF